MRPGDEVFVRGYRNKGLRRIVLEVHETYVLVCRPETFEEAALETLRTFPAMGFPKEDVSEVTSCCQDR